MKHHRDGRFRRAEAVAVSGRAITALLVIVAAVGCGLHTAPVTAPPLRVEVAPPSALHAGVAKVALSLPGGTPLAGYGSGARRLFFPDLDPNNGHVFFKPAKNTLDPIYAKALVLKNDTTTVAILAVDAVGMLGELADRIHALAVQQGSTIPRDNLLVTASHTHSGPGTMTGLRFWELAGTDKLFRNYRDTFVADCARALVNAGSSLQPAKLGIASGRLTGVTVNRRADTSPYVVPETVDEELGVIRVDTAAGTPLAVLWNYAIHGTAFGATNLRFSADVMGAVSAWVETALGVTALFANGAEGDTAPIESGVAGIARLAPIIGAYIKTVADGISPESMVTLAAASTVEPFGKATLDLRLGRSMPDETDLDFPMLLARIGWRPGVIKFGSKWFEQQYRFQALRINDTLLLPIPGEPIYEVGMAMKAEGLTLGFARVFVFGLSNGHMAYVTSEREYLVGGYEGLSTFYGPKTAEKVSSAAMRQAQRVR